MPHDSPTRPEAEEIPYVRTEADLRYHDLLTQVREQTSHKLAYDLDHEVGIRLCESEERGDNSRPSLQTLAAEIAGLRFVVDDLKSAVLALTTGGDRR